MKARNKERIKIVIYAVILVAYIWGFVVVFNYKQIFGIGYYRDEKTFSTTHSGGTGGVNLEIYATHIGATDHQYGIKITAFSNPDSDLEGISYLDYRIATSNPKWILTENYSVPITTYSYGYDPPKVAQFLQYDNLTCKGFADIIFKVNDIDEMHRISFEIGIIIKMDGEAINYELENALTWVNVIYLSCTAIPLTFLFRSIRSYRFLKWYTEEMREADEIFRRELSRKEESVSNKNS